MTKPRRSLPIATTFCSAEIPLFDGLSFFIDGNSKITRENGTYANPKPNAFSLPAASVPDPYPHTGSRPCPGSTPTCRSSCYVKGLAQHAPDLYRMYSSNAVALDQILAPGNDRQFYLSALKLAQWIEENAAGGFRWHVSGDVLSVTHATWITEVCGLAPGVEFWIYTRTLAAVPTLSRAKNLAVNVSADADNFTDARAVAYANGARLCYLTTDGTLPDLRDGSVIFPDYSLRTRKPGDDATWWNTLTHDQRKMVCPTDQHGQSEAHRCGPCRKCF